MDICVLFLPRVSAWGEGERHREVRRLRREPRGYAKTAPVGGQDPKANARYTTIGAREQHSANPLTPKLGE